MENSTNERRARTLSQLVAATFACLVLVALTTLNLAAAIEPIDDSGDEVQLEEGSFGPEELFLRTRARFRLSPFLPALISRQEIDDYGDLLHLSFSQRAYVKSEHILYLAESIPVTERDLVELRRLSIPSEVDGWAEFEVEAVFFRERDRVYDVYVQLEQKFFNQIRSILSEDQLERMDRVIWHRQRSRNRDLGQLLRGARIDFAELVNELNLEETVMARLDPLLRDYEKRVSPTYVELRKVFTGTRAALKRLVIEGGLTNADSQPDATIRRERFAARQARREQILSDVVKVQIRIRDANKEFLPKILAMLPPEEETILKHKYQNQAYIKTVYPDSTDPRGLFEKIMNSNEFATDQLLLIQGAWDGYRIAYEGVCRRMEREFEMMQEQHARTHLSGGSLFDWYTESMRSLWIERWGLNRDFAKKIKALLPPDVFEKEQPVIDRFLIHHEQIGQETLTPDFPEPVI